MVEPDYALGVWTRAEGVAVRVFPICSRFESTAVGMLPRMGIEFMEADEDGRDVYIPVLLCDVCRGRITDDRTAIGNVEFDVSRSGLPVLGSVLFRHTVCRAERRREMSFGATEVLGWLVQNHSDLEFRGTAAVNPIDAGFGGQPIRDVSLGAGRSAVMPPAKRSSVEGLLELHYHHE